ncbi:6-phosphogluconolactonase [Granulicoccus phenolivorans]|uniref:6-phosphogluconolactonase n=1 Tax=Granulicoccus phenolivorans TaxID=266854 RepID=UPI0004055E19|nr:6-phosphogluconolactonase [Granulicoccus phenolivorans]
MSEKVLRYPDPDAVAEAAAEKLVDRIAKLQQDPDRVVQLCLTGGRIANRLYIKLAQHAGRMDSGRVEFWWGDERFVPTDDPDRNAGQTLVALGGSVTFNPALVHPMPAADGAPESLNLLASATAYAEELGDTVFDICLLGIGPDGHVASIFPDHPSFEQSSTQRVIGVRNSPKPPPERISLTLPVLNESSEVWFVAAGAEKADAVARSVAADPSVPAGVVRGRNQTRWWVDIEAAAQLPD